MKTKLILTGYKLSDYLIVLNPHDELANRIADIRQDFISEFKVGSATGAKANLALARFKQYEMKEDRIVNNLKKIAMGFPPFKVELKDFGSFPSHTIYINVTSKIPVQALVKEIRSEAQSLMKLNDDNKPYFIMEPHITIGMKLKPWQYESGWLKYSQKNFTGRFIANSFLLLKRPEESKNWQAIRRFDLQNMPVHTKQGELFG
jgi:2'-5' RNA ligase